jgi:hypothetical protein
MRQINKKSRKIKYLREEKKINLYNNEHFRPKYRTLSPNISNERKYKLQKTQKAIIMYPKSSHITYETWLDKWLQNKKLTVKESTYIHYKNIIDNHIKPDPGIYLISKISSDIIEDYMAKKLKNGKISGGPLSTKSVADIMVIVKETLKYAQIHGEIVNCMFNKNNYVKNTKEVRVLSTTEEQRLIAVITKKWIDIN